MAMISLKVVILPYAQLVKVKMLGISVQVGVDLGLTLKLLLFLKVLDTADVTIVSQYFLSELNFLALVNLPQPPTRRAGNHVTFLYLE